MSLARFALRELTRRPLEAALTALCLSAVSGLLAWTLLAPRALADSVAQVLTDSPTLVVRRLSGGAFAPVPVAWAPRAAKILGVNQARCRLFGVVDGPDGPLPIAGAGEQVVAEPGLDVAPGQSLAVVGANGRDILTVDALAPVGSALVLNRGLLVPEATARRLLGLGPDQASDLALWLQNPSEAEVIGAELQAALGEPTRLVTQVEAQKALLGALGRQGSLGALGLLPALLALALLVAATLRGPRQSEVALLKALGWTTGQVLQVALFKALWLGLPAVLAGLLGALALVLWPGSTVVGWALLGQNGLALTLSGAAVLEVSAVVVALVLLPFGLAVLLPAARAALTDPARLLGEGDG